MRLIPNRPQLLVAASAAALFAASLLVATPSLRAGTIEDLKAAVDSKEEGKILGQMQNLKDEGSPAALVAIKELRTSKISDKVASTAIRMVAVTWKDSEHLKWLKSKIEDKKLYDKKDGRPEVYKAVLDALAVYKDKGALKPLEDVVKKNLTTDPEYLAPAVKAYGSVEDKAVVDQLVDWLEQVDSRGGGQGGGGSSKGESTLTRDNKDKAKVAVLETLTTLTGQDIADAPGWRKWWDENRKTFEFPKPDAPESNVDVTTLKEWTDTGYGYTVKRPVGEGWAFRAKDKWFRIQLAMIDDKNVWWAFAGVGLQKVDAWCKDVEAYAKWWAETQIPKEEISEFSPGGEPKITEKKFAGRDWLVVEARGQAKPTGPMVNWQVMLRRIYITKHENKIFYIACTTKTVTEPQDMEKLWKYVEEIQFAPEKK